jgi:hypothetical protein
MISSIALFFGLLFPVNIYSQLVTKIDDLELIPGKINTYYSQGHKEKAEYLQILIEDAVYFYEDLLQDTFDFDLYIFDRRTWKKYTEGVYPIAGYSDDEKRIVMPVFSYYKTQLPEYKSLYGKGYYFLSDFIAIHELGHYITHNQDAKSHSKWSGEFFADLILISYLHEIIPDYKFDDNPAEYFTYLPFKYKRLENFSSAGILNELAYHPKFQELADQIYINHGLSFILKWVDMYKQLNRDIKEGKFDNISFSEEQIFQESIKDIQSIEPEIFIDWNKSMRQTYHSWLLLFCLVMLIGFIRVSNRSYSIFLDHALKTKGIHKIFGVPSIRIWKNIKNVGSRRTKYSLLRISLLRILNLALISSLILSLTLLLS